MGYLEVGQQIGKAEEVKKKEAKHNGVLSLWPQKLPS